MAKATSKSSTKPASIKAAPVKRTPKPKSTPSISERARKEVMEPTPVVVNVGDKKALPLWVWLALIGLLIVGLLFIFWPKSNGELVKEDEAATKPFRDSLAIYREEASRLRKDSIAADSFYLRLKAAADSASADSWRAGQYAEDVAERGRAERADWKQRTDKLIYEITDNPDVSAVARKLLDESAKADRYVREKRLGQRSQAGGRKD